MATTASHTFTSTIDGASEGGKDLINLTFSNSSAPYTISMTTIATAGGAGQTFVIPAGAQTVFIVPPSTNDLPFRLATSTSDTGIMMSSQRPSVLQVTTAGSTICLFSTGTTAIPNVRVIIV